MLLGGGVTPVSVTEGYLGLVRMQSEMGEKQGGGVFYEG